LLAPGIEPQAEAEATDKQSVQGQQQNKGDLDRHHHGKTRQSSGKSYHP